MSVVGVTTIVFGIIVLCTRGPLLIAPAAALRLLRRLIKTDGRIRTMGIVVLPLCPSMLWAGSTDESGLAMLLSFLGWLLLIVALPILLVFPSAYRAIIGGLLPDEESTDFYGWRVLGFVGGVIGVALIYFGVLAL